MSDVNLQTKKFNETSQAMKEQAKAFKQISNMRNNMRLQNRVLGFFVSLFVSRSIEIRAIFVQMSPLQLFSWGSESIEVQLVPCKSPTRHQISSQVHSTTLPPFHLIINDLRIFASTLSVLYTAFVYRKSEN